MWLCCLIHTYVDCVHILILYREGGLLYSLPVLKAVLMLWKNSFNIKYNLRSKTMWANKNHYYTCITHTELHNSVVSARIFSCPSLSLAIILTNQGHIRFTSNTFISGGHWQGCFYPLTPPPFNLPFPICYMGVATLDLHLPLSWVKFWFLYAIILIVRERRV